MQTALQLDLPLALPADIVIRSRLARQMLCEKLRCSMDIETCIARQTGQPRRTVHGNARWHRTRDPYCQSGDCKQGLGVLLRAGLLSWARCPTCSGCGRVPHGDA